MCGILRGRGPRRAWLQVHSMHNVLMQCVKTLHGCRITFVFCMRLDYASTVHAFILVLHRNTPLFKNFVYMQELYFQCNDAKSYLIADRRMRMRGRLMQCLCSCFELVLYVLRAWTLSHANL